MNNVKLTATNDEIIGLFLNIASSKLSRDETEEKFAEWLVEMEK